MSNVNDFIDTRHPPTSLNLTRQASGSGVSLYVQVDDFVGAKLSSAITSATITEVLSLSGPGVVSLAGLITSTATTATAAKLKIVIDGATAFEDLSIANIEDSHFDGVIGSVYANSATTAVSATEVATEYNSSFVVSVAGDGTNGVQLAYKDYLT